MCPGVQLKPPGRIRGVGEPPRSGKKMNPWTAHKKRSVKGCLYAQDTTNDIGSSLKHSKGGRRQKKRGGGGKVHKLLRTWRMRELGRASERLGKKGQPRWSA